MMSANHLPSPTQTRALEDTNEPVRAAHVLMTVTEVATHLRTSRKAIYAMIERNQLPGVLRIGRRVLVDRNALLHWLRQKSTPSERLLR